MIPLNSSWNAFWMAVTLFQHDLTRFLATHCLLFGESWKNLLSSIFLSSVMGLGWSYDPSLEKLETFSILVTKGRCESEIANCISSALWKKVDRQRKANLLREYVCIKVLTSFSSLVPLELCWLLPSLG